MILLLKTHVQGYTRTDGHFVAPHEDKRKPAQIELFERKPTGGDQVIVLPYASGMSRRRDMGAAIESAAGLGTVINEISRPGMNTIADAIAGGKPVFVDSGAFPAFRAAMKAGKPEEARLDFDKVFARYDELSALVQARAPQDTGLLMMVAPDVVGDQAATLELLETHAEKIKDWIWAGHEVIVPMQRGAVSQFEVFKRVKEMLDDLPFVVGIPSAAAALSNADLRELLSHPYKPDRIHILGAVSSKAMQERMGVIREAYKDDVPGVTADANIMRSKLHELYGMKGQEKIDAIKKILNRVTPALYGGDLAKGGEFFELTKARPTPAQAEAGNYKKPRRWWKGLEIAIENPVGSIREGKGWRTKMQNAYGYICRSEAVDGDEVDIYLGPELDTAPMVYVVHQRRYGDWDKYDEDKCMIGFASEAAARAAYLAHYDDKRFLGPITALTVGDFINKVRATADKPAMIKSVLFLRKALKPS